MAFPTYSTGTVSIGANATTVVGSGTLWTGINARPGDDLVVAGHVWPIMDVTDATHLVIEPWPHSAVSAGTSYKIVKRSPLRFAGGQALVDVDDFITAQQKVAEDSKPFVIFAAGQSNFARSPAYSWSPQGNALVWNNTLDTVSTGTGFEVLPDNEITVPNKVASDIARAHPDRAIYLVNSSFSGQAISKWLVGASPPDAFADGVANVEAALALIGVDTIDLFLWWQGEGDTSPLNANYAANFETMMGRFWARSWFPRETPIIIHSIASNAISGGTENDNMNAILAGVAAADADKRAFVYTSGLSSGTYWDAGDPGHMTAQGYFSQGALTAQAYLSGSGRGIVQGLNSNPATGAAVFGKPSNSTAALVANRNASVKAPTPVGDTLRHTISADGSAAVDLIDTLGNFAAFVGRRANGTAVTKTALASGDLIVSYGGQGHHNSGYGGGNRAALNFFAGEAWTSTANGTYASLYTTRFGTTTTSENVRVTSRRFVFNGSEVGVDSLPADGMAYFAAPAGAFNYFYFEAVNNIPLFVGRTANGTYAARTAVVGGNIIGGLTGQGWYGGSAYSGNQAALFFFATEAWTGSARGVYASLYVTPNGSAAAVEALRVTADGTTARGYVEMSEISTPAAPAANGARLYLDDNGDGKTRLMVRFETGAAVALATQG